MENSKIVYDLKGYTYVYEGATCEQGFIVRPIYPGALFWNGADVEVEDDSIGDPVILTKIFEEKPIQIIDEDIKKLKDTLGEIQNQIYNKKKELTDLEKNIQRIKESNPEELLYERLKEIKNADVLVKAVTHDLCEYGISEDNVPYSCNYNVIAVDQGNGEILHLYNEPYTSVYEKQNISNTKFKTLKEAELIALENVNKEFSRKPSTFINTINVDKLFDKYNIERSIHWKEHVRKVQKQYKQDLQESIEAQERRIKQDEKRLFELQNKLDEI